MKYRKTVREALNDLNPAKSKKGESDSKDNGESDSKDEVQRLKDEIQMLKLSLENEKNKTIKPEPNKDTGEVPLRTGVAHALLDKDGPMPKIEKGEKKLFKKSLGKTKIEVNPDVEIGIASGGKNAGNGLN